MNIENILDALIDSGSACNKDDVIMINKRKKKILKAFTDRDARIAELESAKVGSITIDLKGTDMQKDVIRKLNERIVELEAENEELKCCADLVRFLSETWASLEKLRYNAIAVPDSEIKDFLIMQWPVVQGTQNQINLSAIGKQPYQAGNLAKAVDWMLAQEAK